MFSRRVKFVVCAAALIAVVAQAPAWAAKTSASKSDANATLQVNISSNSPISLDPQKTTAGGAGAYQFTAAYDRLLRLTPDNKLLPMLAESWKWDATNTALTFNLRKDVRFQDGTPFTADVAVQNIKRSAEAGSDSQAVLANIVSTTAVDPYTLRLTFAIADPAIIYQFTYFPGYMATPAALANPNLFKTQSMGSGAYKITSIGADGSYNLERFDGYWDKSHVYPAKMTMVGIVDENTRLNAIKTGQADVAYISSITYSSAKSDPSVVVKEYKSIHPWFIFFNTAMAPVDKPEVRKAISLGVDRAAIAASQNGLFQPYGQVFSPDLDGYVPSIKAPKQNIEQAKKLIQQAGANGATIKYLVSQSEPYPTIAKVLQAQLNAIGLNVELSIVSGTIMRPNFRLGGWHMIAGPTTGTSPDPTAPLDSGFVGPDNPGPKDPKMVDMVAKARQLPIGSKERTTAFQEINKYLSESLPNAIPLATNYNVFAGSKRSIGVTDLPLANISLGVDVHYMQVQKSK